jgi:GH35 family endo-1,4-beta-xylanase
MEWCRAHGVTIKGHPLYWAGVLPKWLDQFPAGDLDHLLAGRILTTTAGFAGEVSIWDVANEAIHDVPFGTARDKPYTLADAADSVAKVLGWAYAGNPNATFVVNEFDVVSNLWVDDVRPPRKTKINKTRHPVDATSPRATFLRLIQEVDRRGVPKYDIGLQSHEPEFDWLRPQDFWDAMDAVAALGHRVHITELEIPSNGRGITGGWRTGNWTPEAQADYGEQMYRLAFGHPAVVSINYWGLSDRNIWRDEAGWLDKDYHPKPIYQRLKGLIKEEWMTRNLALQTDDSGVARFRGFYGTYRATVRTAEGNQQSVEFHLSREQQARWTFDLRSQ